MAKRQEKDSVDLNESSVHRENKQNRAQDAGDVATDATVDRLEAITGGAEDPPVYGGALGREIDKLDATTDEEVDALRVDLYQDDEVAEPRDGTGLVADDLAAEHVAEFTEVGRDLPDKGVVSAVPGRDDTSEVLRSHHPNTEIARAQDVVEGNLEEPRDEERVERKVDEGTAA